MNKKNALLHHHRMPTLKKPKHGLSEVETLRDLNATNDVIAIDRNSEPNCINDARS